MPTFITLLRGVNVGKAKRVPMEAFRELLSGLGYTNVRTLLNSGNAVFDAAGGASARHAKAIATAIAAQLSIEVPVVVKSARQIAAIVNANPLADSAKDHSRLLVVFTQDKKELSALERIGPLVAPEEGFAVGEHAAYLYCAGGILESRAGAALLGAAGRTATTRNWATTLKLHALANTDEA